ncbi:MAG: hypothetical protein Kapaf2KO_13530 [Candidatus Kapaibacteriales bacterium]
MAKKKSQKRKKNSNKARHKSGFSALNKPKIPLGFINQLQIQFPEKSSIIRPALEELPVISIRINSQKLKRININKEDLLSQISDNGIQIDDQVPWSGGLGYYVRYTNESDRPVFTKDPLHHAGMYYVQEAASMTIAPLLIRALGEKFDKEEPLMIGDVCAAPGGKSTHISDLLSEHFPNATLIANEFDGKRALALKDNIERMGCSNIIQTSLDAREIALLNLRFDAIIIDAPCSGEGMFRKDLKSRTEWSPDKVHQLSKLQSEILDSAKQVLKPDGIMIYSTCTFNYFENQSHFKGKEIEFVDSENDLITDIRLDQAIQFAPGISRSEGLFVTMI